MRGQTADRSDGQGSGQGRGKRTRRGKKKGRGKDNGRGKDKDCGKLKPRQPDGPPPKHLLEAQRKLGDGKHGVTDELNVAQSERVKTMKLYYGNGNVNLKRQRLDKDTSESGEAERMWLESEAETEPFESLSRPPAERKHAPPPPSESRSRARTPPPTTKEDVRRTQGKIKVLRARLEKKFGIAKWSFASYVDRRDALPTESPDRSNGSRHRAQAAPASSAPTRRPKRDPERDDIAHKRMMSKRGSNPFRGVKPLVAKAGTAVEIMVAKPKRSARKWKTKEERKADIAYINLPCPPGW